MRNEDIQNGALEEVVQVEVNQHREAVQEGDRPEIIRIDIPVAPLVKASRIDRRAFLSKLFKDLNHRVSTLRLERGIE